MARARWDGSDRAATAEFVAVERMRFDTDVLHPVVCDLDSIRIPAPVELGPNNATLRCASWLQ